MFNVYETICPRLYGGFFCNRDQRPNVFVLIFSKLVLSQRCSAGSLPVSTDGWKLEVKEIKFMYRKCAGHCKKGRGVCDSHIYVMAVTSRYPVTAVLFRVEVAWLMSSEPVRWLVPPHWLVLCQTFLKRENINI